MFNKARVVALLSPILILLNITSRLALFYFKFYRFYGFVYLLFLFLCFMCCHYALCLMSFADSLVNFCQFHFYEGLIVHISSYIIAYDMYVLPFGVIKNNTNNNN